MNTYILVSAFCKIARSRKKQLISIHSYHKSTFYTI